MSMTQTRQRRYRRLSWVIRNIKKDFPLSLPLIVRRKKLNGMFGYASTGSKCYYIYIHQDLDQSVAIDTFVHEISHLLVDDKGYHTMDHGQEWGKMYSRVYRWMEKNYFPKLDSGYFNSKKQKG